MYIQCESNTGACIRSALNENENGEWRGVGERGVGERGVGERGVGERGVGERRCELNTGVREGGTK